MEKYIEKDPWKIVQEGFNKEDNRILESLMSLGNGHMGLRGNLEEKYSGDTLKGTYIAGVYYPDKTRVGWWKNGYPEYFAKVLNSTDLIGIDVKINNKEIDLNSFEPINFRRVLNMKKGILKRTFELKIDDDMFEFEIIRFLSMQSVELGAIKYSIKSLSNKAEIELNSFLNGNVYNEDANYGDYFWKEVATNHKNITLKTKKIDFKVTSAMENKVNKNINSKLSLEDKKTNEIFKYKLDKGEEIVLNKYFSVTTNRDYEDDKLIDKANENLKVAKNKGFDVLLNDHIKKWADIWETSDIVIKGDTKAQQGIRFNIFQLKQTYHGHDPRLNIGPKGFTGEKYGGSTYWDTEAYCLPFYLSTSDQEISKNLLKYRHNHLKKAIENADKLDLDGALYPMVTMNGEECHNEWEITFEEIHRNGAIAYAIKNYINYTGDKDYLLPKGLEVLIQISKFWADRVHFSKRRNKYVMHGVTGPNEYDNNVNNNWYTNKIAKWTMKYTLDSLKYAKKTNKKLYNKLVKEANLNIKETEKWQDIINNIYLGYDEKLDIFLQQDGYLDKEQKTVKDIPKDQLPLVKNWSWDKILRSPYIKQADVLQGIFFFEDEFSQDEKKRNFDFYEPRTVHESSLSPCIYSIVAADIGYKEKAYELYLRTARLDLEDYNKDTNEGLHITSMAGTWMSIVYGFGGFRVKNDKIHLNPYLPTNWEAYEFKILFRNNLLNINLDDNKLKINLEKGNNLDIVINNKEYLLKDSLEIDIN